jgi:type I restriction enzyme M protein
VSIELGPDQTYLLFLKMADERTRQLLLRYPIFRHPWRSQAPYNQKSPVPEKYSWQPSPQPSPASGRGGFLFGGDELFDHYRKLGGAPAL